MSIRERNFVIFAVLTALSCVLSTACDRAGKVCSGGDCGEAALAQEQCGPQSPCALGQFCNANAQCVPQSACRDTCQTTGWSCGEVCGEACGLCGDGLTCAQGACVAGTAGCEECALRLTVAGQRSVDDDVTEVDIAVDYNPTGTEPRPRIVNIWVHADRSMSVQSVSAGSALTEVGKQLYRSPTTGHSYRVGDDGSLQFLALSLNNVAEVTNGRLFTATLRFEGENATFRIVRRDQVFAPPGANQALQTTNYDAPVTVWP